EVPPLQVRIGIHTGLVVAGEMGAGDTREPLAIVGETPNIAARLQEVATPDTVVLSTATYRLIQGYFECQDLGPYTLKGIPTPVPVYQVLKESGAQSRFEVVATTGLTPLVGREQEVGLLLERWERAKEGEGQVVLLSGEAGIGKSRLVQVLKEHVAGESQARVECRCSPYYQNSALYPVIDHLQRLLQLRREDTPEQKLGKLERTLEQYGFSLPEVVPLFASLLSLPLPERYAPLSLTPQKQKQKTLEALLTWLLKEAEKQPVRFVMEDLHWVDPSTLEFLSLLIDQAPTTRLYILLTFRPEFSPPWASRSHLTQITLSRLARRQAEVMVEKVAGGKTLPAEVIQQVITKTDGVPLFVEELTKTVLESGLLREAEGRYELTGPLPPLAIPTTLQDSLMARLDRLASVREVVQLGATLGREFTYELLRAVSPLDEVTLQRELARLVEAELLYQRGLPPQSTYLFKHALIQDAAYQSLLKSKRQQYHQQIAQVLEERFAETREIHPELLAHHYTEAGFIAQAIPYWQRAGQRAAQRSANVEAISYLTKGLELLKTQPNTPKRAQQELALQTTLGPVLIAAKGYTASEVEHAYTRALELCRQMREEIPQLFPVLRGLQVFYFMRAEHKTACELAEQLLTLAQRVQDPVLLLGAHFALGETLYFLGEVASAWEHLEEGLALYDPQQSRSVVWAGSHPAVQCLSFGASALWLLGYPDQALKRNREALTLAQELSHPFSLAMALVWAALLHQHRREGQLAQEKAEAVIALASEQEFPLWLAAGTLFRGLALAEQGQEEEGIAQLRQGAGQATGAQVFRPLYLALLAKAYGKVGQVEEGLTVLAEALAVVDKTGERVWEAELYRLKGELTLKQSEVRGPESEVQKEAEACFKKAIEIARRQSAKSLELRAATSLSRLWQKQGRKEEARQVLAEIYNWFTEGFDTKDLQEAKGLLEELSH
ncbi:MAG TPA: AAA family ATPase, partial [Candidatus Binatia bacterium]|nr:AAA family ATPase [Candidatus Binatia bacterium]